MKKSCQARSGKLCGNTAMVLDDLDFFCMVLSGKVKSVGIVGEQAQAALGYAIPKLEQKALAMYMNRIVQRQ